MDPIKEAFLKIKEDIYSLKEAILELKDELTLIKNQTDKQTDRQKVPSEDLLQTDNPTHNLISEDKIKPLESPYTQNNTISTGNEGVPTDRQTDKQTNRHPPTSYGNTPFDDFKKANEVLNSLDSLKKGIRLKFKRLTNQEMTVFSTLYSFEDQNIQEITYKTLSKALNLSESSIRDYINKLIYKGIPIEKIKQNNKKILLNISKNLKNVATLATILELRSL